ncbi:MAG: hypothetical protein N5P05_002974 [Chroococcopsis gigantea SAG 12.99]|jgi:hypothetical protein|nr:SH3 domain-containing protein [Chlorogloea purpurea SAG 13.99]MDV3001368.1 hypothetical protein [Chroococcopsis gigantea SAG 12.99]
MKRLSGFFQFIIGFILGIVILAGGATALGYVFLSRLNNNPGKPIFSEEKPAAKRVKEAKVSPFKSPTVVTATPAPAESPKDEPLAPGTYRARVTWSSGLSLRADASTESERIGGVGYNQEVIVIGTSNDGSWQKIRLAGGSQSGWVRAGNLEKLN